MPDDSNIPEQPEQIPEITSMGPIASDEGSGTTDMTDSVMDAMEDEFEDYVPDDEFEDYVPDAPEPVTESVAISSQVVATLQDGSSTPGANQGFQPAQPQPTQASQPQPAQSPVGQPQPNPSGYPQPTFNDPMADIGRKAGRIAQDVAQGAGTAYRQAKDAVSQSQTLANATAKANDIAQRQVPLGKVIVAGAVALVAILMLGRCVSSCGKSAGDTGNGGQGIFQPVEKKPEYTNLEEYFQTHPDRWAAYQQTASEGNILGFATQSCSVSGNTFVCTQQNNVATAPQTLDEMLWDGLVGAATEDSIRENMSGVARNLEAETGLTGIICRYDAYGKDGALLMSVTGTA